MPAFGRIGANLALLPDFGYCTRMIPETTVRRCAICGEPNRGPSDFCAACEAAFEGAGREPLDTDGMDLNRYAAKMFPWEPSEVTPRLLNGRWLALFLCFGLVAIVVLLALLRTPIPTCWEVG